VIGTDSQATILALNNQKPHPAHHLLDRVYDAAEKLHINQLCLQNPNAYKVAKRKGKTLKRDTIDLQIHWTSGHVDFPPNE